jgi:hypothetical protein
MKNMNTISDGYLNKNLWKIIFIDQILSDIKWAITEKKELAAAQLLLAAIDTASGIRRPAEQEETTGANFIEWSDKYICLSSRSYKLKGIDLWGARCGFLHGYTPISRQVRLGKAKMLAYVDTANECIMSSNDVKHLAIVSLSALYQSYCNALLANMKEINACQTTATLVNSRLEMMFQNNPLDEKYATI